MNYRKQPAAKSTQLFRQLMAQNPGADAYEIGRKCGLTPVEVDGLRGHSADLSAERGQR